jgi:hypothetical protein
MRKRADGRRAAVDDEALAADVGRERRGQEDDGVGDLLRRAWACERDPVELTVSLRAAATGVAIGPQATTFIRIPSALYSAATDLARLARPAFAAP